MNSLNEYIENRNLFLGFKKALENRFACKEFLDKKIDDEEFFNYILEPARMSPSSFGMEPWRLLVIRDQKIKEQLQPLCWNQKQITTCSHLVVISGDIQAVQDDEYIEKMFARRGLSKEATQAYIKRYKEFLKTQDIKCWTQKQCYIIATNLINLATLHGIDSCPIEGFEKERVEEFLGVENIALLIAFGYCAMQKPPKKRLPLQEIVKTI